ncbi:hypothetical protein, partial [Paracoccus aerius]|uniref:hypothetical protein n=1 Tax=Paracoccus aerius TaxID=1915382 RepID=UPI001F2E82AF
RRMMFKSPMWITPVTPAAHRFGERFTWLNSQWKLRAYPAQFWVEINKVEHEDRSQRLCWHIGHQRQYRADHLPS